MTEVYPRLRVTDDPYGPRLRRLIADAQRTGRELMFIKGAGCSLVTPNYSTPIPHVRFKVVDNRMKLMPRRAP